MIYTKIIIAVLLSIPLICANAQEITVLDEQGQPLANAVIEISHPLLRVTESPNKELYIIDQVDKQFVPQVLAIPQFSNVSFPNSDNIRHHVYSFSKTKPFELKLYAGKPKAPLTFDKSGVVVLGCNIHDSMVGYIYIASNRVFSISNDLGKVELSLPREVVKDGQILIWHPLQKLGVENLRSMNIQEVIDNQYRVTISTNPPSPRNTFEQLFNK